MLVVPGEGKLKGSPPGSEVARLKTPPKRKKKKSKRGPRITVAVVGFS